MRSTSRVWDWPGFRLIKRAQEDLLSGVGREFGCGKSGRLRMLYDLGQSKIENFGMPAIGHENIRRLDVPVHDALRMCRIERLGDLCSNFQ